VIYQIGNLSPQLGKEIFIAASADIIGNVELHDHSNVWYGCVLRGDINKIVIGENSNVQDGSVLHVTDVLPCIVGKNVTIGHKVVLHGCVINDSCLIGMGAVVLDGAVINEGSVVAAGSVVPPGKTYPPHTLIMGSPAKVVRELTAEERIQYGEHYKRYIKAKTAFLTKLKPLP
jgi:carbonic anhydrase/acetyltransferase-like protein (isoleucine patch superfamily)